MSTKHYLLTAKTCSNLTQKYLVVSQDEFDDLPNKEDYIIDGPKDLLDALFDKAEKVEKLVTPYVRWSVMREGYEPAGTFNGNFVDGEFYKIVERGSYSSYWRYRRSMLIEAAIDKIANFESAASSNELDRICNVLYTNLNRSVYEDDTEPLSVTINLGTADDKIDSQKQNDFAKIWEETVDRENAIKEADEVQKEFEDYPTPWENSSSENEQKDQTSSKVEEEQTDEKIVIPVIPGVRLMKLEYDVDASQSTRSDIGLQLHNEIYDWIKTNKELKKLLLTRNYVEVQKHKIKITLFPKDSAGSIRIIYVPTLNGNSYVVDFQNMLIAIKTQAMIELGCIFKVPDSVDSYDPRKQAVEIDCDHRAIPYEEKPERDMRNNIVLGEKESSQDSQKVDVRRSPQLVGRSVTEDKIGKVLDRIKLCTKELLAIPINKKDPYVTNYDLMEVIGAYDLPKGDAVWLNSFAHSLAKKLETIMTYDGSFVDSNLFYMVFNFDSLKGAQRFGKLFNYNINYDKLEELVFGLSTKKFMDDNFFENAIITEEDRLLLSLALIIVTSYIEEGVPSISIDDVIAKIKNATNDLNQESIDILLVLAGFPYRMITSSKKYSEYMRQKITAVYKVFINRETDIVLGSGISDIANNTTLDKILEHYYTDTNNRTMFDIMLNDYADYITDDLVMRLAIRSVTSRNKNHKATR